MEKIANRSDYLAGRISHREFYAAVVATAGIRFEAKHELVERARKALANGDEHLNSIPLARWDSAAFAAKNAISRALKAHGDFYSAAGGVCVMKEAVRQAVERSG